MFEALADSTPRIENVAIWRRVVVGWNASPLADAHRMVAHRQQTAPLARLIAVRTKAERSVVAERRAFLGATRHAAGERRVQWIEVAAKRRIPGVEEL